jgi:hypothetical protein
MILQVYTPTETSGLNNVPCNRSNSIFSEPENNELDFTNFRAPQGARAGGAMRGDPGASSMRQSSNEEVSHDVPVS